ncbi:MAG: sulfatase [Opitutaceae bacterium]|jgi:arylsulfatase A-like enzyme|nr:sulfatase [Opitutaceae bacterium]
MILKSFLSVCLLGLGVLVTASAKPLNVVLFVVDDLGVHDLGFTGSSVFETPHIDAFVSEGVWFSQAYSAYPRCVPSRYGLMTGVHPSRAESEGEQLGNMNPERVTLAEALQAQGYATFFAGKWHLGKGPENWPEGQGYDINVAGGSAGAPGSYFTPYLPNKKLIGPETLTAPAGEYLTDRLTSETVDFMRTVGQEDRPFFVTLCHYAVHTPIQGKPEKTARYQAKIDQQKFAGSEFKVGPDGRELRHQTNAEYASMVESVDESLGQIIATLKGLGIFEETLILFTSDHGGLSNTGPANKRELATSNAPLRAGKGHMYEGGIRVPLIVRWPGVSAAGGASDLLVSGLDLYPTILDALDLPKLPAGTLDGVSFAATLAGGAEGPRDRALFWYSDRGRRGSTGDLNAAVVRQGDFKLIEFFNEERFELYDLVKDPRETTNLVDERPKVRDRLRAKLSAWKKEMKVKDRSQTPDRAG